MFGSAFGRGDGFEVAPSVPVVLTDDVESGRDFLKPYSPSTSAAWGHAG